MYIELQCKKGAASFITRTSVAPRRHLVLVGILGQSSAICISAAHRQNMYLSMSNAFIDSWLLTDGRSIFYMSASELAY